MYFNDPVNFAKMPSPDPNYAEGDARLSVLDSFAPDALEDDPELAAIAAFAAKLTGMPIGQVTLVEHERQRFIAGEGLKVRETPRSVSFCDKAMCSGALMEVRDATKDERFQNNALVTDPPMIRYYAGQPLVSAEGAPLGALCVIDSAPHEEGLNDFQREGMAVLGQAVMRRLQFRRDTLRAQAELEERERRMHRIIEGVPQIAWSADSEGRFDYFNSRWKKLVGTRPPHNAGEWEQHIHPDDWDAAYTEWQRCFAEGEEFDAEFRLKYADGKWGWVLGQAVPVAEREGGAARWFGTVTDIDEVRQALEERDLLAKELSHRIKNVFAVVIGLASLKVRKTPEHKPFADELTDVLRSLNRAHDFVRPDSGVTQDNLRGLLNALFAAYLDAEGEQRIRVTGADADITHSAATPLALVFHELATNSAKYGALSAEGGFVTLDVEDRGKSMLLVWTERGGPPPVEKNEDGFGSRLVEMSVSGQLAGSWERRFEPSGLVVELTVSKDAIAR
ncbi:MAG: PAS domain-containing protein [Alteraurantiacibacter sp.]